MKIRNAVMPLLVINAAVYALQMFFPAHVQQFILVSSDVFTRPWILITSMFMHGGGFHLLFNMYVLFMFGPLIEQRIGTKRFLLAYFGSGLLAALGFSLVHELFLGTGAALGASGAIMGILGLVIMLLPDLQVLLFFVIPMSMRTAGVLFVLFEVYGIFFMPGIANEAHLVGLAVGLAYGLYLLKQKKQFHRVFVRRPMQRKGSSYEEQIHMSAEEVDEYLRHGKI